MESTNSSKDFFNESQWDLIYAMAGHALDDPDWNEEDVYAIRSKIHNLFVVPVK